MIALGCVTFLAQQGSKADTAAAAPSKSHKLTAGKHGVGYTIGGEWFGTWRTPDGSGFCIEFDKGHPTSTGASALPGRVPGMSSEDSARVKYVANKYGPTSSKVDAAASAIYVWKTQRTNRFNSFYAKLLKQKKVSATIRNRVTQIAAEAANHGPYKLTMTMGSGLVGQSVSGVVTAHSKSGKVAPGLAVALTAKANGVIVRQEDKTDAQGHLAFTAKVTRIGAVQVDAKLSTPAAGGVWITRPSAGHQRLVLGGRTSEAAVATISSQLSANGPSVTSTCTTDCAGVAPVTVTMSNPCGAATVREFIYVDGNALSGGTLDVEACKEGKKTVSLADNATVTTRYCYLDMAKNCTDTPVVNTGNLVVNCPALPAYRFAATCPCGGDRSVTYEVQAPVGSRRSYSATLTVKPASGPTWTRTIALTSGWQSLPAATLTKGSTATLTVTVLGKTTMLDALTEAA